MAERIAAAVDARPRISATTDRRRALEDADYVVLMIQVAGYKPGTVTDFEVPKKRGLRQTIADTLGIGGIMRGLRTAPVLIDIARDMMELCPNALMLQYVNPMAINCAALSRVTPSIRTVGLCHSVQGTAKELAADIGVPAEDIRYLCAGINHMAFYLKFERRLPDGSIEDLYPRIRQVIEENRVPDWNRVRYEVFRHFGYFVTESSEHFSEYVPWFIKRDRPDLIEKFNIPLDEYIRRCEVQIARWDNQEKELTSNAKMEVAAQQGICRRHHPRRDDRQADRHQRQCREPRPHRQPARRHLRRGAVPDRPQRRAADPRRPPAAAARGADADQHQRAGADGRGDRHRRAWIMPSMRPCSIRTPRPNCRSRRFPTSSTICSRRMAIGCRAAPSGTPPDAAADERRRVALVGTGHRGAGTWGKELLANCRRMGRARRAFATRNSLRLERARDGDRHRCADLHRLRPRCSRRPGPTR